MLLEDYMREQGLTMASAANRLGVARQQIRQFLKEGRIPSLPTALRIERLSDGAVTVYDWCDREPETALINRRGRPVKFARDGADMPTLAKLAEYDPETGRRFREFLDREVRAKVLRRLEKAGRLNRPSLG